MISMRQQAIGLRYGIEITQDLIRAGEYAVIIKPRLWAADQTVPTVIYAGGYSAGGYNLLGFFAYVELARRGFCVVASDLGDTPSQLGGSGASTGGPGVWGYDHGNFNNKVDEVVAFCENKLRTKPNSVIAMGGSHGGGLLNWVRVNQSKVECGLFVIPVLDFEDVRANNRNGYAASVEAAYDGNTNWQTLRPTHNPVEYAGELSAIPTRIYASENDPICIYGRAQAYAAAAGSNTELISLGNINHTTSGMPWSSAVDWIENTVS